MNRREDCQIYKPEEFRRRLKAEEFREARVLEFKYSTEKLPVD